MNKVVIFVITLILFLSVAVTPVWSGGGQVCVKNRGDTGLGETHQIGFDSQGNQAP